MGRIEQVHGKLPQIEVYLYLDEMVETDNLSATLNKEIIQITNLQAVKDEQVHYLFLIDCSTSVSIYQMDEVKGCINSLSENLKDNEDITIISFGLDVNTLCNREKDNSMIANAAELLIPNQEGTVFYNAMALVAKETTNDNELEERQIAFAFSDSIDVNAGGYTQDEVEELLLKASIPVYGFGFENGSKEGLDAFGAIARQSGGTIQIVNNDNMQSVFMQEVEDIRGAYKLSLNTGNNLPIQEPSNLRLQLLDDDEILTKEISILEYAVDNEEPVITEVTQLGEDTLQVVFSEKVEGANQAANYVILDQAGSSYNVAGVSKNADTEVVLQLAKTPASGELILNTDGITDCSRESNEISTSYSFSYTNNSVPEQEEAPVAAWFLSTILVVAVIFGVVMAVIKKRGGLIVHDGKLHYTEDLTINQEVVNEKHVQVHVVETEIPNICMNVSYDGGDESKLEVPINKSLFFGRSDICDVCFDDKDMSRQHFVIEESNGEFYIENLSQTNGTFLNGILIGNKRPLHRGDKILAGREELVFLGTNI